MKIHYVALTLALSTSPAWALNKRVDNGKTSFQERPCAAGQQTTLTPQYEPAPITMRERRPVQEEVAAEMEHDRLRRTAETTLVARQNDLYAFRQRYSAQVAEIASRRYGYNNNLAGAIADQSQATAAAA
jgi:hypothetical protein